MELKTKVWDKGNVVARLRSIAKRVPEEARKQMHRAADHIEKDAKLFTPEYTGALAASIHIEKTYDGRGRLQLDVVAGDGTLVTLKGRVIDLSEYALEIHENYEEIWPTPGKNTQAKMAANPGVQIGSHFLTRAMEKQNGRLQKIIAEAVLHIIRAEKMA